MVAGVALVLLVAASNAHALGPSTTLESRDSTGTRVGAGSSLANGWPAVSANGRYVIFMAEKDGIVPGDTNGNLDYFLRDRMTGQTRAIDVGPDGKPVGMNYRYAADISADGRYVAFPADATRMVAGELSTRRDLFIWDRLTGAQRRFQAPDSKSIDYLEIDADGGRVAFVTDGSGRQVFVADAVTGTVSRVSQTQAGVAADGGVDDPSISADGNWVAFSSNADNLVTGGTPGQREVYLKNLTTGEISRASIGNGSAIGNGDSYSPSVSGDGCVIAFSSEATNLVAGDAGTTPKVFARDRCEGTTERISVTNAATDNQRAGSGPDISEDGCLVAFASDTVYSQPPTGNAAVLRDRCTGSTTRLDLSTNGDAGGKVSNWIRLSGGPARYAVFPSNSTNLVADDDAGGERDIFLRDRADHNVPPVAALDIAIDGLSVTADATGSYDPDGPSVTGTISFGDDTPTEDGVIATHQYAQAGTYSVTATVEDTDGSSATKTEIVTIEDTGPTGPTGPIREPILKGVSLSRKKFQVAPARGKPKAGQGTTLTVKLAAAATVSLRFDRVLKGRRKKGKCSPKTKKGPRCKVFRKAGKLYRSLSTGTNKVALSGRVGRRKLSPGRYRLTVATGDERRTVTFTILKKRR